MESSVWTITYQEIHERDGHDDNEGETYEASKMLHGDFFLDKVMVELNSSCHHVEHLENGHVGILVRQLQLKD